jgi:predicted nucleic acid-binding protein
MKYLLDANVFIQAKNLHYGFDFCPAFWRWLERENDGGRVLSTEKVGDELIAGNDELAKWAETQGERFFVAPDSTVVPALTRVSTWATTKGYEPAAVATFLQVADYWLVAHALAHQYTIVTHEVPAETARKIKIPNACLGLGIHFATPYEMLRRERARFVLEAP